MHVFFPRPGMVDFFALVLCAIALFGLLKWKWNVITVIVGSGIVGVIYKLALAQ
jgi:hypothetical protein